MVSDNIEDYYTNPYDLGYGPFVKFDHDFIGAEAIKEMSTKPQRRKVTLEWNADDVGDIHRSMLNPGELPYKFLDMPLANYSSTSPNVGLLVLKTSPIQSAKDLLGKTIGMIGLNDLLTARVRLLEAERRRERVLTPLRLHMFRRPKSAA